MQDLASEFSIDSKTVGCGYTYEDLVVPIFDEAVGIVADVIEAKV